MSFYGHQRVLQKVSDKLDSKQGESMTDELKKHYKELSDYYDKLYDQKADMPFYTDDLDDPHWSCPNCGYCQEIKIFRRYIHNVDNRLSIATIPDEYEVIRICKLAERETENHRETFTYVVCKTTRKGENDMRDIEERAIRDRFCAMDSEELQVGLKTVPDSLLLREIVRRYSFMLDLADQYERVRPNVEKAHEISYLEWR